MTAAPPSRRSSVRLMPGHRGLIRRLNFAPPATRTSRLLVRYTNRPRYSRPVRVTRTHGRRWRLTPRRGLRFAAGRGPNGQAASKTHASRRRGICLRLALGWRALNASVRHVGNACDSTCGAPIIRLTDGRESAMAPHDPDDHDENQVPTPEPSASPRGEPARVPADGRCRRCRGSGGGRWRRRGAGRRACRRRRSQRRRPRRRAPTLRRSSGRTCASARRLPKTSSSGGSSATRTACASSRARPSGSWSAARSRATARTSSG